MAFLQNHSCITAYSLREFTEKMVNAIEAGVDPRSTSNFSSRWDLSNAFFFCGTIITTIGFGNISPKTKGGQLFCIFYALVGIPMFGILLAGVGDHLGTLLRRTVAKIETLFLHNGVKPTSVRIISAVFSILIGCLIFIAMPTMVFQEVESWSLLETGYFVVVTLTTVGFGDYNGRTEGTPLYKTLVWLWIVFGLAYFASILTMIGNWLRVLSKKTRAEMEELRAHATDWTQNIQNMSMDFRIPVPLDLNDPFKLQRRCRRKHHHHHCHPRLSMAGLAHGISLDAVAIRENGHLLVGWPESKYNPASNNRSEEISQSRSWSRLDGRYERRPGSRLMAGFASRFISRLEMKPLSRPVSRAISSSPSVSRSGSVSGSETPSESWSESESNSHKSEELESGAKGSQRSLEGGKDVPIIIVASCTPPSPSLLDFFGENLAYIDESSDTLSDRVKPAGPNRPCKPKRRSLRRQIPHSYPTGLQREISSELQPPSHPLTPIPNN
ncbi:potassium channel subfamily K member 2 [Myxocyprinus asiaticus]|uniref:potassium channel subfamily K member 2 n=1 Tax=Myxocyprinus asiaticus TaxID=70543 RepID=UPI002222D236|nr:potassium channel subfamily K member 2 [Myxocyprinus asiaticus]